MRELSAMIDILNEVLEIFKDYGCTQDEIRIICSCAGRTAETLFYDMEAHKKIKEKQTRLDIKEENETV